MEGCRWRRLFIFKEYGNYILSYLRKGGLMQKNIFKRGLIVVLFLLVFVISFASAEEKKYPPYPDVWGYEISLEEKKKEISFDSFVIKMPEGDYLISKSKKVETEKGPYWIGKEGILFFSGKVVTGEEYEDLKKRGKKIGGVDKINLSDKSIIELEWIERFTPCPSVTPTMITKRSNKISLSKVPIVLLEKPVKTEGNSMCEKNWTLNRDYIITRLMPVLPRLFPLEDEAFLLIHLNIVIRLDKDLNTKSHLLNKSFFLLDKKVYDKLSFEGNDQQVADAIYKHIINLKKGR